MKTFDEFLNEDYQSQDMYDEFMNYVESLNTSGDGEGLYQLSINITEFIYNNPNSELFDQCMDYLERNEN